jgi:hypothetical protein
MPGSRRPLCKPRARPRSAFCISAQPCTRRELFFRVADHPLVGARPVSAADRRGSHGASLRTPTEETK